MTKEARDNQEVETQPLHRYEQVYAELIEAVPELGLSYGPEYIRREWEWAMSRADQPISQEDREYLLSLEINNAPAPKSEDPLLYCLFEDDLRPWLFHYSQRPEQHARLAAIMDWLEELARDGDQQTRWLVSIGICEGLLGNDSAFIPDIFPFMGETMRQMCRDFLPFFRVSEEIKALFAPSKNTRRFAKRP